MKLQLGDQMVASNDTAARPAGVIMRRAADVIPEHTDWLWKARIPAGAITVIAGDPGLGKSLLTARLVADITRGRLGNPATSAVMLTAEDSLGHTVRPRLEAAGADLERVMFGLIARDELEMPVMLPDDLAALSHMMAEQQAALVVVDPLSAHLSPSVNNHNDHDIRTALSPVAALAHATGAAVVIVAHLNKGQSKDPLQRLGGSIGIPAVARSVLLLARDPDDPDAGAGSRRVLAHVKSNLGQLAGSLLYKIRSERIQSFPDIDTAVIAEIGASHYLGSDLLQPTSEPESSRLAEASEFLERELLTEAKSANELLQKAEGLGISTKTLKRAKKQLGVESTKEGARWEWRLPVLPDFS